jgi:hypothetical protein
VKVPCIGRFKRKKTASKVSDRLDDFVKVADYMSGDARANVGPGLGNFGVNRASSAGSALKVELSPRSSTCHCNSEFRLSE